MKKMIRRFAAVFAVVAMVFAFSACGGTDMSGSPYLGTWSATSAEYSGIEMSVENIIGGEFTLTLNDDGSCDFSIAGETESGDWTETESGFNVEDEFDFAVDGDIAVMDYDGISICFERQ